jgi:hypothetical protein
MQISTSPPIPTVQQDYGNELSVREYEDLALYFNVLN